MVEEAETKEFRCKEGPVIIPEQTLLEKAHQNKWKNTLIGKLHITEKLRFIEPCNVIRDISRAWNDIAIFKFTITELSDDMFGFHLEHHDNYRPYLVLLTEWHPNTPPSKIEFSDSYPFWVQLHDIPFEYVSRELRKKIGEGTGHQVLDVDVDGINRNGRSMKCLRVRVLVNVNTKLATGYWLLIDKNQPKKVLWVSFRYEELPMFCHRCGIIGHWEDSCRFDDVEEDEAINYSPEGSDSELPAVLVEGQVLRVVGEKGYGWGLYAAGRCIHEKYEEEDEDDEDYDGEEDEEEESDDNNEAFEGLVDEWGVTSSSESDEEMETEENELIEVKSEKY